MCETCPEETAIDFARGLLSQDEAALFRRHLWDCAACCDAVCNAEAISELLGFQTVEPRAAADMKVRQEIHRQALLRSLGIRSGPPRSVTRRVHPCLDSPPRCAALGSC